MKIKDGMLCPVCEPGALSTAPHKKVSIKLPP